MDACDSPVRELISDESCATVFRSAAEAIAKSLATGRPLRGQQCAQTLQQAFLQEDAARNDEAADYCQSLRSNFADELRRALAAQEATARLLRGDAGSKDEPKPVHVEVRGTAGRQVAGDAFLVGSAPECDVQLVGDMTLFPLQCVVVQLSGGIVVADFWSSGRTRMTWRWAPNSKTPPPRMGAAFYLANEELAILKLGMQSTVKLAPGGTGKQCEQRTTKSKGLHRSNAMGLEEGPQRKAGSKRDFDMLQGSSAGVGRRWPSAGFAMLQWSASAKARRSAPGSQGIGIHWPSVGQTVRAR